MIPHAVTEIESMTEILDQKKKQIQLKARVKLEEKTLTTRSAWTPLNGSTRQEEGTSLFLLKEVKRRTSFSKSFK
jgi:hypothetical protein